MDLLRHSLLILVMALLLFSANACSRRSSSVHLIEPSYSYVKEGVKLSRSVGVVDASLLTNR